ncbi:TcpE family conjugal transfer membrane protein [Nonomuraea sp. MCN248]|uniref:TcpE family conjugal transfer membrane protein n=1 Tax=Nonomuraea corallina TaxID=2989783 RepID=A0ABT4SIL4_9ACTN|nr:TcpE family conjugal transfer membrane protein [Nonomuraea corallina]MDA0637042.1 TcpE family conjugal transfer membrane protein [Nonomuraea corallina]
MDLPTYTNIWRIEKRLYKLYDLRLPMPLPIVWIGVFVGVLVPWSLLLWLVGVPVAMPWHVLFLVPPGIVTWLSTRPVIEGKRLTELLESQLRYLGEPKAWYRLASLSEPETVTFSARVWRAYPVRVKATRKSRQATRKTSRKRAPVTGPRQVRPAVAAAAAAAAQAPVAPTQLTTTAVESTTRLPVAAAEPARTGWGSRTRPGSPPALPPHDAPAEHEQTSAGDPAPGRSPRQPVRDLRLVRDTRATEHGDAERSRPAATGAAQAPGTVRDDRPGPARGDQPVAPARDSRVARARDDQSVAPARDSHVARDDQKTGPARSGRPAAPARDGQAARRDPSNVEGTGVEGTGVEGTGSAVRRTGPAAGRSASESSRTEETRREGSRTEEAPRDGDAASRAETGARRPRQGGGGKPIDTEALRRLRKLAASADGPTAGAADEGSGSERVQEDEAARSQHRKGQPPKLNPALLAEAQRSWAPLSPDSRPVTLSRPLRDRGPEQTFPLRRDETPKPARPGDGAGAEPPKQAAVDEVTGARPGETAAPEAHRAAAPETKTSRQPHEDAPEQRPSAPSASTPANQDVPAVPASPESPERDHSTTDTPSDPADRDDHAVTAASGSVEGDERAAVTSSGTSERKNRTAGEPVERAGQTGAASEPAERDRQTAAAGRQERDDRVTAPSAEAGAGASAGGDEASGDGVTPVKGRPARRRALRAVTDPEPAEHEGPEAPAAHVQEARPSRSGTAPEVRPEASRTPDLRSEAGRTPDVRSDAGRDSDVRSEAGREPAERAQAGRESGVRSQAGQDPRSGRGGEAPADERGKGHGDEGRVVPGPRVGEAKVRRVESVVGRDSGGWRRVARVVVGGNGVRGDGSEIDEARARSVFSGSRRIVVLGCTGGAGQSTTALMLGHTLAHYRDDRVVALDAGSGESTLSSRIEPETPETLTSLLAGLHQIGGYLRMRGYTTRTSSGLEVVGADGDAEAEQRLADRNLFSDERLGDALALLDRHYKLTVIDPAAALAARMLPYADQLVLVVPASEEAPEAVGMTYEWLDGHGCADLRRRAVMVVNGVSRRSMPDVEQAEAVASGRCRAIVRVPWEDDLAPGGVEVVDPGRLRTAGRRAYLALAGVVVAGFAAQRIRPSEEELAGDPPGTRIGER